MGTAFLLNKTKEESVGNDAHYSVASVFSFKMLNGEYKRILISSNHITGSVLLTLLIKFKDKFWPSKL